MIMNNLRYLKKLMKFNECPFYLLKTDNSISITHLFCFSPTK